MSQPSHPTEGYASIMGRVVEWLVDVYQDRLEQAKNALASAETILGGIGYEERAEGLATDGLEHPTPQRSLARLASWFAEIERELEERRTLILNQQWESMAGEYALVAVQNLTEARQYLGLAQSAVANLLVSLATNKLNAWEKQTKLYAVRLYLERVETAIVWAIESASNGLRQNQIDGSAHHQPQSPAPPRVSTGAVSYRQAASEPANPSIPPAPTGPETTSSLADIPPAQTTTPASAADAETPPPEDPPEQHAPRGPQGPGFFGRLGWRKRQPQR
ncbi:MAG TPA: hypothetical protein VFU69_13445 [Ktedonobacterales bacterium]|nr:hypothetical protein [Ktedonobacterales bacterium]